MATGLRAARAAALPGSSVPGGGGGGAIGSVELGVARAGVGPTHAGELSSHRAGKGVLLQLAALPYRNTWETQVVADLLFVFVFNSCTYWTIFSSSEKQIDDHFYMVRKILCPREKFIQSMCMCMRASVCLRERD